MSTQDEAAGERLAKTVLRDFAPPLPAGERNYDVPSYVVTLPPRDAPIPVLLRHALTLVGIPHHGPSEKVAWWVDFTYKGYAFELAHQKFGLRLRIGGDLTEEQAGRLLTEVAKKLLSAVTTVEALLSKTASETLNAGNVTVVNQHRQLRRAYSYFRERAANPDVVEDVSESGTGPFGTWSSFQSGKGVMATNAFHDLVATISAYVSSLEHDLVLALPFLGFDPSADSLIEIIGDRWGKKWRRSLGHTDLAAVRLRERLTEVIERWRNPYSHGGFEKGHRATIYLHTPGLGALPVSLSGIRDSPLFSFHAASETDIVETLALFDEIDAYLAKALPHAMEWIESGLDVRFDAAFVAEVNRATSEGSLERLIDLHLHEQDRIANMDY